MGVKNGHKCGFMLQWGNYGTKGNYCVYHRAYQDRFAAENGQALIDKEQYSVTEVGDAERYSGLGVQRLRD